MPYLAKLAARISASLSLLLALGALAPAAAQASQRVTIVVPEVEQIQTSGGEVTLAFETPVAGQDLADVSATTTYSLSVNTAGNKVTGELGSDYAEGLRLSATMEAPEGARSLGRVALATTPRDLVADVASVSATGLALEYVASADARAFANGTGESQTVTFTITDQ